MSGHKAAQSIPNKTSPVFIQDLNIPPHRGEHRFWKLAKAQLQGDLSVQQIVVREQMEIRKNVSLVFRNIQAKDKVEILKDLTKKMETNFGGSKVLRM